MTVREEIAAMAMQGILANTKCSFDAKNISSVAVKMADALIAELARTEPPTNSN